VSRESVVTLPRPGKGFFNETEAAQALGISLEQFRALVLRHILDREEDLVNLPITTYQPSDLLLLRLLASQHLPPSPSPSR
jgi:hypothetical protein